MSQMICKIIDVLSDDDLVADQQRILCILMFGLGSEIETACQQHLAINQNDFVVCDGMFQINGDSDRCCIEPNGHWAEYRGDMNSIEDNDDVASTYLGSNELSQNLWSRE